MVLVGQCSACGVVSGLAGSTGAAQITWIGAVRQWEATASALRICQEFEFAPEFGFDHARAIYNGVG